MKKCIYLKPDRQFTSILKLNVCRFNFPLSLGFLVVISSTCTRSANRLTLHGIKVFWSFKCCLALLADKTFDMPLFFQCLDCFVCDRITTTSALGQYSVGVAVLAVRVVVLSSVAHIRCKLCKTTVTLEMFRMPGLIHCSYTIWCNVFVTLRTFWYKVLLIVSITVQFSILWEDRDVF